MKKFTLMIFAVAALISCQKETLNDSPENEASAINLTINVNRATRAVEGGHSGANDDKVSPKVLSVTVISYNSVGTELGTTDLSPDQIKLAVWGNYQELQSGAWNPVTKPDKPSGAKIGLPKGTAKVDVVVNRAPSADYTSETNINYFNYRDNKNGNSETYSYGTDNFDRVMLTTANFGKGSPLSGATSSGDVPTYNMAFDVKPYMARLEVFGGINVAPLETWTDGHGNQWHTATVDEYKTASGEDPDTDGKYSKGAVKGTVTNGFDLNTVYIPEYYWFRNGANLEDPAVRKPDNTYNTEGDVPTNGSGWIPQPHYNIATYVTVKWLPNRYYAVDVESVFVNNIKIKSIERTPYMHQWPGSAGSTFWVDWYKAYHIEGWHKTGTSTGNTFLCMGNMWDRIAEAKDPKGYVEITIPEINGVTKMQIINGKAKPTNEKSVYYDDKGDRNIGIATNKAAAYVIYPQAKQDVTSNTDASTLRHELPHIILKVKVYENPDKYLNGIYVKGKEFITLSLFSDAASGTGNYITNFKGGNIYRFNLNDLLYSFVGNVPVPGGVPSGKDPVDPVDPDPEMPESELTMTVKVMEWVIENMFPVI